MRLFVAILLSEEIKTEIQKTIITLRSHAISGTFVSKENLHLTLAFLGETNHLKNAKRALDRVEASGFSLTTEKCGVFHRDDGDIFWVGIQRTPELLNIASKTQQALQAENFKMENRSFTPHITLARRLVCASQPNIFIPKLTMSVTEISLMCSERKENGMVYTEVYKKKLTL